MTSRGEIRGEIEKNLSETGTQNLEAILIQHSNTIDLRGLTISRLCIENVTFITMFSNGTTFDHCQFHNCRFIHSDFRGVTFKNVTFTAVIFQKSKLLGAHFSSCSFTDVSFFNCDLTGSHLNCTSGATIDYQGCILYKTGLHHEKFLERFSANNFFDFYYNSIIKPLIAYHMIVLPKIFYIVLKSLFHCDLPFHAMHLGKNCRFSHLGFGTLIVGGTTIGDNTWIGPNVSIFSRNTVESLTIGKNVVIGLGSIISANIGDNVIIGAGSSIFHDIPDNSIVYGTKSQ